MSKCIDFYEENDNMERAISAALIEYNLDLEDYEEIPEKIKDRAIEIAKDWADVEETNQSLNRQDRGAFLRRIK